LKPQFHEALSNVAFNLSLRRYNEELVLAAAAEDHAIELATAAAAASEAGVYTCPLFSST
jgi:hypothetical protein